MAFSEDKEDGVDVNEATTALTQETSNNDNKGNGEKDALQAKPTAKLDDFVFLGKYSFFVCVLSELIILCQLGNMLYMTYAGAAPTVASCGSMVFDDKMNLKERCAFVQRNSASATVNGTLSNSRYVGCEPKYEGQFHSVNLEFEYYCANAKWVKQTISIQMLGVIVGAVIFGNLSDTYGRRKIMLVSLVLCIIFMITTSFSTSLFWFTIWRFLVCVFNGGTIVILMVWNVENLPKKDRFWISNLITWSPNIVLFAVIAYFAEDWKTLTRVSALLAVPAVGLLMYLCESPRFLVQNRQLKEAKEAITRIHRIDNRVLDEALLDQVLNKEEQLFLESAKRKKYTFIHLFYTWTLARYTVVVAFSMMVTSIMNYSLLFNMEKLSGSLYLNSVYMGLFRYSCNLVIAFLDVKFIWVGRKFVHFVAEFLSAMALLFICIVYVLGYYPGLADRIAVLSVIGVCSLLFTTNGVASNELFPTPIRNTSYSFGQVFSRLGVVLAPQIYFLTDLWTPLPFFVMFCLAVMDLLLFQFNVIETKGRPLGEHMPGKEERIFYRNKNIELLPKQQTKNENATQLAEA